MLAAYRVLSGKEGEVEAIHAGLECGLFVEKLPGLDAISLGPDLRDVHSINERLSWSGGSCKTALRPAESFIEPFEP